MTNYDRGNSISGKKVFGWGAIIIASLFVLLTIGSLVENVRSDEIVVIQYVNGSLKFVTQPGPVGQWFGTVTRYPRRAQYEFETSVRFNDGGHGTMKGSVQWEMPLDDINLRALHTKFGSADAVQKSLIEKVVNKSVYMTGPLMSSKESYAEKRNYLINYVEDQIANGVYRTLQHEARVIDPLTGQEKSAIVVDIQMTGGIPQRQETSALNEFGIRTFNFAINELPYDEEVEKQIKQQQQIAMDVQTAIADARKAEQAAITVEQQGKASAAQAKWEQEVIKAKEVTAGEQRLAVAKLNNQEADQYREATLKKADADSTYRRRVMEADGALSQKLDAYVKVNSYYAEAVKNHPGPWVPNVVMGNGGTNATGATALIDLLTVKTATDLGISTNPRK